MKKDFLVNGVIVIGNIVTRNIWKNFKYDTWEI